MRPVAAQWVMTAAFVCRALPARRPGAKYAEEARSLTSRRALVTLGVVAADHHYSLVVV